MFGLDVEQIRILLIDRIPLLLGCDAMLMLCRIDTYIADFFLTKNIADVIFMMLLF